MVPREESGVKRAMGFCLVFVNLGASGSLHVCVLRGQGSRREAQIDGRPAPHGSHQEQQVQVGWWIRWWEFEERQKGTLERVYDSHWEAQGLDQRSRLAGRWAHPRCAVKTEPRLAREVSPQPVSCHCH